ncbi:Protein LOL2 [Linum grandiflorum]
MANTSESMEDTEPPPPGWEPTPPSQPPLQPPTLPPPQSIPPSQPSEHPPTLPPPPPPSPPPASPQLQPQSVAEAEMAQMVCGSCQRLLSYPKGAKHVKCSSCQTLNFVLQAHEVGLVNCGSCPTLLMYPYGSTSVRCSSCQSVTEIGEHNRRPPWSVTQGHPPISSPNAVH